MGDIPFLEVFIDTPLSVCEARDPKGLYDQARAGKIPNFTGISAPYEAPTEPDLALQTRDHAVADSAQPQAAVECGVGEPAQPLIAALFRLSAHAPGRPA